MQRPKKIAIINLNRAHWLGGQYYLENLIRVLSRMEGFGSEFSLSYVVRQITTDLRDGEIGRLSEVIDAPEVSRPPSVMIDRYRRFFAKQFRGIRHPAMHFFLEKSGFDFAYPTATGGESISGYRTAHWIADLQYRHFPQFWGADARKGMDKYLSDIVTTANTLVVSSEYGAGDCSEHFPTSRDKLFVMPFRVAFPETLLDGDARITLRKYNLPKKFFLVCNQFWQNKNHMDVFSALGLLKESGHSINVIFTGHIYDPRLPKYADEIHARIHELGIHDQVFLLGAIDRLDQINLLKQAGAVIQPSRFEGWNTTIEEARALGRHVIASKIPVHNEQSWPGMRQFDLDDASSLADAMMRAWEKYPSGDPDPGAVAMRLREYEPLIEQFGSNFLKLAGMR